MTPPKEKAAPVVTGLDVLQAEADEAHEKGYSGTKPDGPANETFTLTGVTSKDKK